jgi:hypothetical protein
MYFFRQDESRKIRLLTEPNEKGVAMGAIWRTEDTSRQETTIEAATAPGNNSACAHGAKPVTACLRAS